MGRVKNIFLFFLLTSGSIAGGDLQLNRGDVSTTFNEMVGFHVEEEGLTPSLIKRALKIYVEQFDIAKMYFTKQEMRSFSNLPKKRLEEGVKRLQAKDLSDFVEVNLLIEQAIERARLWRSEAQKELIFSTQDLEPVRGEAYLSYAASEEQLKERVRRQMVRFATDGKLRAKKGQWNPKTRERLFAFWERRVQREEESYLSSEKGEHYLALHTLKALAKSLDAHTAYFSPKEALEMRTSLQKQFEGVGVILQETVEGIEIAALIKGGPAEKSRRIFVGDSILKIDGANIEAMSYDEVLRAMKGDGSKELSLTVDGKDGVREVLLIRERIAMDDQRLQYSSVPVAGGQIGLLNLPSFYEGGHSSSAERDMRDALKQLKKSGDLKGVILDMRENSGGFLTQAVKVAGLFISRGVVVISKYARGEIKYLRNLDGRLFFDGPLIILTSHASASAAEIVAQALQDYGTALIVGDEQTYGKGTIQYQTVTDPRATTFYKVTVGRYYTVSGRSTQIEGVKADIVVPTIFSSYKIGERFLEYPLQSDQVAAAYIDPLTDIDYRSRAWFQKNYLPKLHKQQSRWQKALPVLKQNSEERLAKDQNFVTFLKAQKKLKGRSPRSFKRLANPPWGSNDLQLEEAIRIMQDMIALSQ